MLKFQLYDNNILMMNSFCIIVAWFITVRNKPIMLENILIKVNLNNGLKILAIKKRQTTFCIIYKLYIL